MSTNILFVFEGEKTENLIVKSLERLVLNHNVIIKCAFSADIYQLYREVEADDDLDVFNLIKERNIGNTKMLENYQRKNFAEIYLFFDYDAHASLASSVDKYGNVVKDGDEKIKEMLSFFNNETDKGKLYISYPMVEAIRHIINYDQFHELRVKCKGKNCPYMKDCEDKEACMQTPHYKQLVSSESIPTLCNINGYTKETWRKLINAHLCKMNYIIYDILAFPNNIESQLDIFKSQFDKYIYMKCPMVAVLSAFPIFVFDYYGHEKTFNLVSEEV